MSRALLTAALVLGSWLEVNGEAIYETRLWARPVQWSEGTRELPEDDRSYTGGDYILKQTVDPPAGYAVKEAFFTQKDDALYAITPRYPEGELVLRDVEVVDDAQVTLLARDESISWRREGEDLVLDVPPLSTKVLDAPYAFVFKIARSR